MGTLPSTAQKGDAMGTLPNTAKPDTPGKSAVMGNHGGVAVRIISCVTVECVIVPFHG